MNYTQSNTKRGSITVATAIDLTGKEGYLVCLGDSSGTPTATLPGAATDIASFVVVSVISSTLADIQPLTPECSVRVVANTASTTGLTAVGSKVVAYASSYAGQANPYAGSGAAFIVGIVEEGCSAVGQYLKIRPVLTYWTA